MGQHGRAAPPSLPALRSACFRAIAARSRGVKSPGDTPASSSASCSWCRTNRLRGTAGEAATTAADRPKLLPRPRGVVAAAAAAARSSNAAAAASAAAARAAAHSCACRANADTISVNRAVSTASCAL